MSRFAAVILLFSAIPTFGQEPTWPQPGEYVLVELSDGRTLHGIVTSETTSDALSLARTLHGVTIESEVAKSKVSSIKKLPPPELKMDEPPPASSLEQEVKAPVVMPRRRPVAKVRSIEVRARLANWDADPEPDGLLVAVAPLDSRGNFVPVAGNINLELYGERHQQGGHIHDDREPFALLDQSSKTLRTSDAGDDSYVIRFTFRRFHPDRDLEIDHIGLLRARLSIPGQGVFENSDDWTVLRSSSRYRDSVQLLTGNRYLKQESTSLRPQNTVRRVSP